MRTRVYVDGLNLYYGAVKGTPFKWLDPVRLSALVLWPRPFVLSGCCRSELPAWPDHRPLPASARHDPQRRDSRPDCCLR